MPIEDRNLTKGTQLVGSYKKETYLCRVETGEDGKLAYVLGDGSRHKSPSSAASAVMGGKAVNGWIFWSLVSGDATGASAPEPKAKRVIYKQPNQRGVDAGFARYWCNACMKGFLVGESLATIACPEGHS